MKKQNANDITDTNYHLTILQSTFFWHFLQYSERQNNQVQEYFLNIDGLVIADSI